MNQVFKTLLALSVLLPAALYGSEGRATPSCPAPPPRFCDGKGEPNSTARKVWQEQASILYKNLEAMRGKYRQNGCFSDPERNDCRVLHGQIGVTACELSNRQKCSISIATPR